MTTAERKHLARYAGTIDQQAEFGGVEAIDLLDGSISVEDDALRESVADAHRAGRADGTLPKTLSGVRIV